MKITSIKLENFRGFRNLEVELKSKNIIISGVNGCGKSSILEAINFSLSRFASTYTPYKAIPISDENIKNKTSKMTVSLNLNYDNTGFPITINKERVKRSSRSNKSPKINSSNFRPLTEKFADIVDSTFEEKQGIDNLPILVYYPTDRNVIQVPVRIRQKHIFDQASAYDGAFNSGIDFKMFFEWYRNQEDIENEKIRNNPNHKDVILDSVREAIYTFLPGFSSLRIQRTQQKMVVQKGREILSITQLSDGEKSLLALIGDLARRLALANPALRNPHEGKGVVLIDEIDLHLHPSLQRHVVETLPKTFPHLQFILTTHSPQILGSSKFFDVLFISKNNQGESNIDRLVDLYGRDSNLILEEFMGASSRDKKIKEQLSSLFQSISSKDIEEASRLYDNLETVMGRYEPSLKKAEFLLSRLNRR